MGSEVMATPAYSDLTLPLRSAAPRWHLDHMSGGWMDSLFLCLSSHQQPSVRSTSVARVQASAAFLFICSNLQRRFQMSRVNSESGHAAIFLAIVLKTERSCWRRARLS